MLLELVVHVGSRHLVHKTVLLLEILRLLRRTCLLGIRAVKVHLKFWHEVRLRCIVVAGEVPSWLRLHILHKVHIEGMMLLVGLLRLVMSWRVGLLALVVQGWLLVKF